MPGEVPDISEAGQDLDQDGQCSLHSRERAMLMLYKCTYLESRSLAVLHPHRMIHWLETPVMINYWQSNSGNEICCSKAPIFRPSPSVSRPLHMARTAIDGLWLRNTFRPRLLRRRMANFHCLFVRGSSFPEAGKSHFLESARSPARPKPTRGRRFGRRNERDKRINCLMPPSLQHGPLKGMMGMPG